ncbi:MAG TPA: AAA family ATPase [Chitinivibrionales bacterium]|nr:AAA family ATPase [Chitinivibrionales bacterium]
MSTLEKITDSVLDQQAGADNQLLVEPWNPTELRVDTLLTTEPDPVQYLIDGVLPKGIVGVFAGEGGIAKSLAALDLSIRLACFSVIGPTNWLGTLPIMQCRKVLYCNLEDDMPDLHRRLLSLIRRSITGNDAPDVAKQRILTAITEGLFVLPRERALTGSNETFINGDGNGTVLFQRLQATCDLIRPELIVMDTRTKASKADENDNAIGGAEMETWSKLRDQTGASILIISHTNKLSRMTSGDFGSSMVRGASSYTDNARWVMTFKGKGLDCNGNRVIEVGNPKNNRCKCFEPFSVSLQYPRFVQIDEKDIIGNGPMEAVLRYVKENPGCKQRDAIEALGGTVPKNAVNKSFQIAVRDKTIVHEKREGGDKGYYIA